MSENRKYRHGRFEADEIREGDSYELSGGYPIRCSPTGGRSSDAAVTGAAVLRSDPKVDAAGLDTGYSPTPDTLRAPDVAVGNVPREPGWVKGVPPASLDAVRAEGEAAGRVEGEVEALRGSIFDVFAVPDLAVGDELRAEIVSCQDADVLRRWMRQAVTTTSAAEILARTVSSR